MAVRGFLLLLAAGPLPRTAFASSSEGLCASPSSTCEARATFRQLRTNGDHNLLQKVKVRSNIFRAKQAVSLDIKSETGLMYGSDNNNQVADIYWPDRGVPAAGWTTVIAIHGVGGTEKSFKTLCSIIAQSGRQCISIDYHALGKGYEGMVECSSKAVDWARSQAIAQMYNIDTSRIVLLGFSRGGFITGDLLWNDKFDQTRVAGGIIANGIWSKHEPLVVAGAYTHVPVLALSTSDDKTVQKKFAEKVLAELRGKGGDVTHVIYPRGGHDIKKGVASLYQHISDFLHKLEKGAPLAAPSVDNWPQVCTKKSHCECFDAGSSFTVADLSACQDEADKLGHRFVQYYENTCATTSTCDDSSWLTSGKYKVTQPWKVYWRPVAATDVSATTSTTTEAVMPSTTEEAVAPPETPSTTENRFCRNECLVRTQSWTQKCKWNKCSQCSECEDLRTPEPPTPAPTEYRFCKDECSSRTQAWSTKCKWNKCKECPECSAL